MSQGRIEHLDGYERVLDGDVELARIVRGDFLPGKTTFMTPGDFRQQLGFIVYGAGQDIRPHRHNPIRREILGTAEIIFVRTGRCYVDFYNDAGAMVSTVELKAQDVLILVSGGHGFRMLEDTVLMEVKQGPYSQEQDKVYLR